MLHPTLAAGVVLANTQKGGGIASFLPLIVIAGLFYVAIIRPQRKRAAQARATLDTLTPGRRVMTTAGLYASVVAIEDAEVVLEVAPGVHTRWARGAISRVLDDPAPEAPPADETLPPAAQA